MNLNTASNRPDVLIVSAAVGAGHKQAARALVDGLRQARPDLAVEHVDVLDFTNGFFRLYYSGGFTIGMTRLPRVYGLGFKLTDRPHGPRRGLGEKLRMWFERLFMGKFVQFLLQKQPRLIVNTHFLCPPIISRLKRAGRLTCPQMTVVTDNVVHRWWYSQDVEHWFLPAEPGVEILRRWGIEDSRVTVSGMPIHPKWIEPLDRNKILADWRLPSDKKIVLLSGGTEFTCGPIVKIARSILESCPEAAVVVLAGRNKKLLADLSAQSDAGKRLFPQGFTDRSQELVEISSLMVTKPGGVTTAECLSKGTPMVLLKPVPGQEGGNALYFQKEGAAVIAHSYSEVVSEVKRLLGDRMTLSEMGAHARRLYKPGTQTIADFVVRAMERL